MSENIKALIPMAHVADVQRSVDFYNLLGFEAIAIGKHDNGHCYWAHVKSGKAHLMFAADSESVGVDKESTVVLYLYADDLIKLREELVAKGVKVSEITYPFYMQKGEVCLNDPDGYVVLIGQSD
jgi:catechol 2,3-dioxygenase-like lactoylglutathione lyase family enzyme